MNDGYFSFVATWCLLIIVWSGWFNPFLLEQQLNRRATLFFLFLYLVGGGWTVPFLVGEARLIPILVPLAFAAWFWIKQGDKDRIQLVAASLLIAAAIVLMQILFRLDPILMIIDEKQLLAIFSVLLVVVTTQRFVRQWILLVFGLAIGDFGFQLYMWGESGSIALGSPFYQDVWWLSFCLLAFVRIVLSLFGSPFRLKRKRAESTSIARIEEIK